MFGYFNDGVFQMMTNKFKKLFENVVNWDNTKEKPKKKKHFDGKKKDLLQDNKKEYVIWGIAPGKSSEEILIQKPNPIQKLKR